MPGGRIPSDGRPPQAPGVGKTAKRHDLEAPATPGLHDSDLQQGEVSQLENAQRVAPIGKRTQPAASPPAPQQQGAPTGTAPEVPDPIAFASGKIGGGRIAPFEDASEPLDAQKWRPLLEEIARNPQVSGPLTTSIMNQLSNFSNSANTAGVDVIDMRAADEAVRRGV